MAGDFNLFFKSFTIKHNMRNLLLLTVIAVSALSSFGGCKARTPETTVAEASISGRVHVLFADGTDPEVLVKAFSAYSFENKGLASRSQNKYAFSYKTTLVNQASLIKELEKHKDVIQAELMKN